MLLPREVVLETKVHVRRPVLVRLARHGLRAAGIVRCLDPPLLLQGLEVWVLVPLQVPDVAAEQGGHLLFPTCESDVHDRLAVLVHHEGVRLGLDKLGDERQGSGSHSIVQAVGRRPALEEREYARQAQLPHCLDDWGHRAALVEADICAGEQLDELHTLRLGILLTAGMEGHSPAQGREPEVVDGCDVRFRSEEHLDCLGVLAHACPRKRRRPDGAPHVQIRLEPDDLRHRASAVWDLRLARQDMQQTHELHAALGAHGRVHGCARRSKAPCEAQIPAEHGLLQIVIGHTHEVCGWLLARWVGAAHGDP
mmetsp:Transcript_90574/g.260959  ORF Transcript_90574/g.260959 Transcript_90574/m.260959 type:complete len:310 (-) Transcript_90574:154-1083(-)